MEDANICPICFDAFTRPKLLQCKHTFCFKCLKEYVDGISSDKQELPCPLCRTKCQLLANRDLSNILTNYFIQSSNQHQLCQKCKEADVSSFCNTCELDLCRICFKAHVHTFSSNSYAFDEENGTVSEPRPPLHLMFQNIRTKYICQLQTRFVVDTPPDSGGNHVIYCIRFSRLGGVLVVPVGVPFLLRMDKTGKMLDRIRTPSQCVGVIELNDSSILGTFPFRCLILRYVFGGWSNFANIDDVFVTDLAELSDGNILACGPKQTKSHDIIKTSGSLYIYSCQGQFIKRLDNISQGLSFRFPQMCAYDAKNGTIAIADSETNSVTVLLEDGQVLSTYKGGSDLQLPFLGLLPLGLQNPIQFHPCGLCYNPNGTFVVSTADGVLHILDHTGKLRGICVTDCEDGFGRHVTIGKDGTIWCTDLQPNGSIKTFKVIKYNNDFSN